MIPIHVTHEALQKIGGIGSVLEGLLTSNAYKKKFPRTLLFTPMFYYNNNPLTILGDHSTLLYSSAHKINKASKSHLFSKIEQDYGIRIFYGIKSYTNKISQSEKSDVEILAIDIWNIHQNLINEFKYKLWKYFGIQSDRYKHDTDYEQYLRIAIPLFDLFKALYEENERAIIFSHEYMGMPCALDFEIRKKEENRQGDITIFYAHEVSTARVMTENHPGHDFAFYNIMQIDRDEGISLEEEFGSHSHYSRNELVKQASHLDFIFAVSDMTKEEYLYLCPKADETKIKTVYNGIYVEQVPYSEKEKSLSIIQDYCENLFNFRPDYILTHVARLIASKGMWRDISLLYYLDEHFTRQKLKGFFVLLSSLVGGGRSPDEISTMESNYGWPVLHREGWPDLLSQESEIYHQLEIFNSRSRSIKGVFINQFGFDQKRCGKRMPSQASFFDLRLASDIEFGLSIYEPFGIAQLETLPYGGYPLITNVCGCSYLLQNTIDTKDYLLMDSTSIPQNMQELFRSKTDFLKTTQDLRNRLEKEKCQEFASKIMSVLPKSNNERKERFIKMQKDSHLVDWEHITQNLLLHFK